MRERWRILRAMDLPPSVIAKLDRAHHHVEDLTARITAFSARNPYRIVQDHNADLTEHYLHLRLREPFPAYEWGSILGDAVHNLRSALDHLIYGIGVRENGDPPPDFDRLMFPILDPPKRLAMNRLDSLSQEVRTAVQREQPDPARLGDSMLWRVDQLDSADKHRVVGITVTHGEYGGFIMKPSIACVGVPSWNMRPLDGKAPLLRLAFDRPVPKVEMGSVSTALICIEQVVPRGEKPDPVHPWVVGNLLSDLEIGVRAAIDRVWAAVPP